MGITGWGGNVSLYVEADLSQAVDSSGSIASSLSLWDAAVWDSTTYSWQADATTWTDITQWVRSIGTTSGFARNNWSYNAATASIVLDNRDGRFSPDNTSSPYRVGASTSIGVWRPLRIRATYTPPGSTASFSWPVFTGYIRSWDEQWPEFARDAIVTVQCSDVFAKLAAFNGYAQTPAGTDELTGARVARVLANAGYKGARYLDVGVNTVQATTLASNALTELKLTADSEGGAVWCGPDGAIRFDGQNALIEKARSNTVQATFADDNASGTLVADSVASAYDGELTWNLAAYARAGGTVQTAAAQSSRTLYGDRQLSRSDLVCSNDTQVATLARRDVGLYNAPERRIDGLTFFPQGQNSATQIDAAWQALSRQLIMLRALVRVKLTPPAGDVLNRLVYVQGINHTITPDQWRVGLTFTSATVWSGLFNARWDVGTWDSTRWSW